jgi:hypothetical protein
MVFFNIYVLAIFIGFILLLILIISGAILIYSGRARINRRNIFILIIYRLVQRIPSANPVIVGKLQQHNFAAAVSVVDPLR